MHSASISSTCGGAGPGASHNAGHDDRKTGLPGSSARCPQDVGESISTTRSPGTCPDARSLGVRPKDQLLSRQLAVALSEFVNTTTYTAHPKQVRLAAMVKTNTSVAQTPSSAEVALGVRSTSLFCEKPRKHGLFSGLGWLTEDPLSDPLAARRGARPAANPDKIRENPDLTLRHARRRRSRSGGSSTGGRGWRAKWEEHS